MGDNSTNASYGKGTATLRDNLSGIEEAVRLLSLGKLVGLPTETVYGLAADARNGQAVAAIYEAKGRPKFNPLIVHVADIEAAKSWAELPPELERLCAAFWPGPLTVVAPLRKNSGIASLVIAGLPTVALRVPAHPTAQAVLRNFGHPIAAPSANPSGKISPTNAAHVLAGLNGRIAMVLDGGNCQVGLESTIVAMDGALPVILRPGAVTAAQIAKYTTVPPVSNTQPKKIEAPGQLASHYAPATPLRICDEGPREGELFLGFGELPEGAVGLDLSPDGILSEAAANLFGHLHALDARAIAENWRGIAAVRVPHSGLGIAINDRLRRAAHR